MTKLVACFFILSAAAVVASAAERCDDSYETVCYNELDESQRKKCKKQDNGKAFCPQGDKTEGIYGVAYVKRCKPGTYAKFTNSSLKEARDQSSTIDIMCMPCPAGWTTLNWTLSLDSRRCDSPDSVVKTSTDRTSPATVYISSTVKSTETPSNNSTVKSTETPSNNSTRFNLSVILKDCNETAPLMPKGNRTDSEIVTDSGATGFLKGLEDVILEEVGLDATFTCEVSGSGVKVEWFKAGKPIKKSDKYDIKSSNGSHTLIVKSCQAEDVAKYSVKANGAESSAQLDVKVSPRFLRDLKDETIKLKVGESKTVDVPFSASPQPKVSWTYNTGKLPDLKRFKVDTTPNKTSLTMSKVIKKDAGRYELTVENTLGRCDASITLVVMDKPGPPENLEVTGVTETSVALRWAPPRDDGGSEIIRYVLEKRESGKKSNTEVSKPTSTEFSVENPGQGVAWVFRVAAENECGRGEYVELDKPVTLKGGAEGTESGSNLWIALVIGIPTLVAILVAILAYLYCKKKLFFRCRSRFYDLSKNTSTSASQENIRLERVVAIRE